MPIYRYSTLAGASNGALQEIEAPDRASAVRLLVQSGKTPTKLEQVVASEAAPKQHTAGTARFALRRGMTRAQLVSFIRELATAVNAGLPLVQALRTIARQGRTEDEGRMLSGLIEQVEHGHSLSDAMRAHGRPFSDLIVSLVNAGEIAGRLGEVLTQAARLLERDAKLRSTLMGAMLYPLIIAGAVTIAIIIVVTVIVPRVLAAASGQLARMPLPTRIVQGVSTLFTDWWWLIALVVIGGIWGARRVYRDPSARLAIDRWLLGLPVVGGVLRDVAVARFTRTFGTLISAGLPVITALRITRGTLGNRALESAIDEVCERVAAGRTIAEPLERCGLFPPLLVQIVSLGEQTGRLDEMLSHAAGAFEDKTEQSVKTLTTVLPPILIVTLAIIVGFVVMSILLPLIELQESIG